LDVLLNNAGGVFSEYRKTPEGLEYTFALNHMSYFILANELQTLLLTTAKANPDSGARIINVSSGAHQVGANWNDVQFERRYNAFSAYGQSKYFNVLHANELARRLQGTGVTANSLHPGAVGTGFGQNGNWLIKGIFTLARPLFLTPEQGAQTSIYLASSPEVNKVSGKYFHEKKPTQTRASAQDPAEWARLWNLSEEAAATRV
jgi:NAD(P)-dependent dehydrogenase (short-subunit alcohol dehydrogenase family)